MSQSDTKGQSQIGIADTPRPGFGAIDLLLMLMTMVWGSNFTVIKTTFEDMQPLSFNGLRFAIASTTFVLVTLASGRNLKIERRYMKNFILLGLVGNTLYQTLFILGVSKTRAGTAALIVSTTPLFTALIGRIRREEYFTIRGVIGLMFAFAGMALIVSGGRSNDAREDTLVGHLMLLGSSICWAVYTVGAKQFLHSYGSIKTTSLAMLMGTPLLLVICTPSLLKQDWSQVRLESWGGLAFSAFLSIVMAYVIWNYGVSKIGSTRTAVYANLTTVNALIVAWAVLGEIPTWAQVGGAGVIFVSIYLVRRGMIALIPKDIIEGEMEEASVGAGKN